MDARKVALIVGIWFMGYLTATGQWNWWALVVAAMVGIATWK